MTCSWFTSSKTNRLNVDTLCNATSTPLQIVDLKTLMSEDPHDGNTGERHCEPCCVMEKGVGVSHSTCGGKMTPFET